MCSFFSRHVCCSDLSLSPLLPPSPSPYAQVQLFVQRLRIAFIVRANRWPAQELFSLQFCSASELNWSGRSGRLWRAVGISGRCRQFRGLIAAFPSIRPTLVNHLASIFCAAAARCAGARLLLLQTGMCMQLLYTPTSRIVPHLQMQTHRKFSFDPAPAQAVFLYPCWRE
jgi:hypothetical protein